jgi:probable 2-oxoglutarate dehydrogenase E1 component DHKTD1
MQYSYSRYTSNFEKFEHYIKKFSFKYANKNPLKIDFDPIKSLPEEIQAALLKFQRDDQYKDKVDSLIQNYLSSIGVEIEHLACDEEKEFLYNMVESQGMVTKTELVNCFRILCGCEKLEEFLTKKFPTFKRYSGEGINSLIPLVQTILAEYSEKKSTISDVVIAMGHRGRLNLLAMVLDYPVKNLIYKIDGYREIPQDIPGIDDMVTHIAPSKSKIFNINGDIHSSKPLSVSMVHNPSHLEMSYPVGVGKVVAKRNDLIDTHFSNNNLNTIVEQSPKKVNSIIIHGDAAVSGQGVVYETLSLMNKETHMGSIHIITNNQIGFTTEKPWTQPSDIFKSFDIPILQVNANDLESVIKIGKIAEAYTNKYSKDICINLIGWRKYGHNEVDEPAFTQPKMYNIIRGKTSLYNELREKMIKDNICSEQSVINTENRFDKHLNAEYEAAKSLVLKSEDTVSSNYNGSRSLTHKWSNIQFPHNVSNISSSTNPNTGINKEKAIKYIENSVNIPEGFVIHPRLRNFMVQQRLDSIKKNSIDWATGEAIAFSSLLDEGYNVRISGQDSMRGTFSQRHVGFVDQINEKIFYPFEKYYKLFKQDKNYDGHEIHNRGRFEVNNSVLSELGVLLFEYGYSIENPNNLVLWEAQFGDFSNTAQLVFDNFLCNSEAKWMRQTALTILLPHGFDDAGPEHSTSRMERLLQLVNHQGYSDGVPTISNTNLIIAQPTTSSNYFHILRRQMKLGFRKPLIVITPKIGLRHADYNSKIEDFENGSLNKIITHIETKRNIDIKQINTIVFTSGQAFTQINNKSNNINADKSVVIRIEELAPFPVNEIKEYLKLEFSKDSKIIYLQEESLNSGAFAYSEPYLRRILKELNYKNFDSIKYIGRKAQEGANGTVRESKSELKEIITAIKNELI